MRIAICGTHYTGKTTLVSELKEELPGYTTQKEAYYVLEDQGYQFLEPPCPEDFEKQIACSCELIEKSKNNTIFDRSPLDALAYLMAIDRKTDPEDYKEIIEGALNKLDLIVFVPIETRDIILVPESQDKKLRAKVDELLYDMIMLDTLCLLEDVQVLEVTGSVDDRLDAILDTLVIH